MSRICLITISFCDVIFQTGCDLVTEVGVRLCVVGMAALEDAPEAAPVRPVRARAVDDGLQLCEQQE